MINFMTYTIRTGNITGHNSGKVGLDQLMAQ